MATKQNAADLVLKATFENGGELLAFRTTRIDIGEECTVLYVSALDTGNLYCLGEVIPMDEDEFYGTFNTPEGLTMREDSPIYNGAPTTTEEVA